MLDGGPYSGVASYFYFVWTLIAQSEPCCFCSAEIHPARVLSAHCGPMDNDLHVPSKDSAVSLSSMQEHIFDWTIPYPASRESTVCPLRTAKMVDRVNVTMLTVPEQGRVPGRVENEDGAFFRWETTNQSPCRATTGGTRRGQGYQEAKAGA